MSLLSIMIILNDHNLLIEDTGKEYTNFKPLPDPMLTYCQLDP